ncbi:MAG TPA: hypothetical protein VL983_01670 [Terriglobales bacterium]|nr:hypothetical protein [Terriglobales bacterium]
MTREHKIEAWIVLLVTLLLTASVLGLVRWQRQQPLSLRGAVLIQNDDPHKQQPIGGVTVSAGDLAEAEAKSDSSGFFVLKLRKRIRKGYPIVLSFRNPIYRPLDVNDIVANKIYVVHMVPLASSPAPRNQPEVQVTNVRVRYAIKAMTELNVGSAVKTFVVENKGNVPCKGQHPCSPDGKWKAAISSATLDAGPGNQFRDARASCIAGPCPFTQIETDHLTDGGQKFVVAALNWSETTTFLLEAEVFRPMASQTEHRTYPVVFGDGLSFTLPFGAQSVSIEADLDAQTIIFPLGPALFLSWATCDEADSSDRGRVFRCTPKPGYRFE